MLGKTIRLFLAAVAAMLSLSSAGVSVFADEALKTQINVTCNTDTKAVIEYTGNMPEPSKKEISISAGKTSSFEINVYDPGTYTYTVKQSGTDTNSKLDKSVYDVSLYVTIDNAGRMKYEVYAAKRGETKKTAQIIFENEKDKPTPTPSPTVKPGPTSTPTIQPAIPGSDVDTGNRETAGMYYLFAFMAVCVLIISARVLAAYHKSKQ